MKLRATTGNNSVISDIDTDAVNGWRIAVALVLSTIFCLLVWYGNTIQSMVTIWSESDTHTQCFLVAPISAWMIWQRRHIVAALDLQPDFRALLFLALSGFGWFLGQVAGVGAWQPFCVVLMIPLTVWAILGPGAVRALAFPLFFLFFAIPFGDSLITPMMEYTADFTVAALKMSGIPVYRDGLFFTIPSGNWSVVEACAGLRYLIASFTIGVLYAYVTYRSMKRRLMFVALSVIVPIIANWIRAYVIVMIGHLSENRYATGVDHLIGGWLFFGLVMLVLFWIGSTFREDYDAERTHSAEPSRVSSSPLPLGNMMLSTIAVAGVSIFWPIAAEGLENSGPHIELVLQAPNRIENWEQVGGRQVDWAPRFQNPSARVHQDYGNDNDQAGLYIAYYREQRPGAELITSGNTLVADNDHQWQLDSQRNRTLELERGDLVLTETILRNRSTSLIVWHWYWVDGQFLANPLQGKLLQAKNRIFGRSDDAAVVIVYRSYDGSADKAVKTLKDFATRAFPEVSRLLEAARAESSRS